MKRVYSSKRDDILKRKAEYEADYAEKKSRYDAQYSKFKEVSYNFFESVADEVRNAIGHTTLDLDIQASERWGDGICVRISDEDNKFDDNKALAWSYSAEMSRSGEIKKESSSWSGLNACTPAAIDNLKEIVRVIEIINNLDWTTILGKQTPKYKDYVSERDPAYGQKPNFDEELKEADVDECVGKNILIKGVNGSGNYYRGQVYYHIVRATDKQYVVEETHENYLDNDIPTRFGREYRVTKKKFLEDMVPNKIETIEY